jgi:hypothetical protein
MCHLLPLITKLTSNALLMRRLLRHICITCLLQSDQNVPVHLIITVQCIRMIPTQLMIWGWPSQNTFGMWTVLYWTRSSRTQFGVSINIWRLAGNTLNITCNFLYCNHQVHRNFLIALYLQRFYESQSWSRPLSLRSRQFCNVTYSS